MKKQVRIRVEFTADEIRAMLIAEVEKSCGPAPAGTVYECDAGYRAVFDMTVENVPVATAEGTPE